MIYWCFFFYIVSHSINISIKNMTDFNHGRPKKTLLSKLGETEMQRALIVVADFNLTLDSWINKQTDRIFLYSANRQKKLSSKSKKLGNNTKQQCQDFKKSTKLLKPNPSHSNDSSHFSVTKVFRTVGRFAKIIQILFQWDWNRVCCALQKLDDNFSVVMKDCKAN